MGGDLESIGRLNPLRNVGREITAEPSGNGPVALVLPPIADCAATGAMCIDDGRKLSGRFGVDGERDPGTCSESQVGPKRQANAISNVS